MRKKNARGIRFDSRTASAKEKRKKKSCKEKHENEIINTEK